MGGKPDLPVKETFSNVLQRDHRTIKNIVASSRHGRKKRVQPKLRKLTERQLWQIHRQVVKTPLATSMQIFKACIIPKMCRATRCKALREVASVSKAPKNLPLNWRHKTRRIE